MHTSITTIIEKGSRKCEANMKMFGKRIHYDKTSTAHVVGYRKHKLRLVSLTRWLS